MGHLLPTVIFHKLFFFNYKIFTKVIIKEPILHSLLHFHLLPERILFGGLGLLSIKLVTVIHHHKTVILLIEGHFVVAFVTLFLQIVRVPVESVCALSFVAVRGLLGVVEVGITGGLLAGGF